jgi:hypothetical protein
VQSGVFETLIAGSKAHLISAVLSDRTKEVAKEK